jgi:hypothetical protein
MVTVESRRNSIQLTQKKGEVMVKRKREQKTKRGKERKEGVFVVFWLGAFLGGKDSRFRDGGWSVGTLPASTLQLPVGAIERSPS